MAVHAPAAPRHAPFAFAFAPSLLPRPRPRLSAPHSLARSSFCLPLRPAIRPALPPRPRRPTPTAHTHCSPGAHEHEPVAPSPPSPLSALLQPLTTHLSSLRLDARPAALASLLLLSAASLHLLNLLPLLSRLLLHATLLLTGLPALLSSAAQLLRSRGAALGVDVLMSLAALVLFLTGAVFESALLAVLYAVSHAAEHLVNIRARAALDALRDAAPTTALRLSRPDPRAPAETVPVSALRLDDLVLVPAQQLVPVDAVVVEGAAAFVSLSLLTGEATPRPLAGGDSVPAGARPEDAPLVVRVTRLGAESALARIARLVTSAQENRPAVTRFFDRFGRLYARSVLVVSALIAALLPVLSRLLAPLVQPVAFAGRSGSLARGLGFLVAASPCALLIGGPVAYLAALSSCAKKGVLTKSGAKSLEAASRATHVVFDKTGTLTTGKLTLTSATMLPKGNDVAAASYRGPGGNGNGNGVVAGTGQERRLLDSLRELEDAELSRVVAAAAALERGAVHPIATAVQKRADQLGGDLPHVSEPKVVAGQGVKGVLSYDDVDGNLEMASGRLGRPSYIFGKDNMQQVRQMTAEASSQGETVSALEIGADRYLLRLKDEVRPESEQVVQDLKKLGLEISVLTGDGEGAAQFVSNAVGGGITVVSNATPEQKLKYVEDLGMKLSETKNGVVMVGDGVNDAAALAASLLGVACGLSSATAVHAADIVLVSEDLHNVGWFLKKAHATKAIVMQNLIIALGLMVVATGACVAGAVPLWLAVTMHEGGTVLVGLNGLRLLRER